MYTSNRTGTTYALNTTWTTFADAENTCNGYGGHLVAWKSVTEQQEVEGYYLRQGYLLPTYHENYWLGLNTSAGAWPRFNWTERTVAPPGSGAYQHWGRPEGGVPEPNNNRVGLCGVANASLSYTNAWGWADTMCNMTNAFICRMQREAGALGAGAAALARALTCFERLSVPAAADRPIQPPSSAPPAAPLSITYVSPSSGSVFTLNTTMLTQAEAQRACNRFGAHLAVYTSAQEQNEVEAFFSANGYLLPTFHKAYWLGLQMREGSTAFSFLDASIQTTYLNWGLWVPSPGDPAGCPGSAGSTECSLMFAACSPPPDCPGPQVPDRRARRELPRAKRTVRRRELCGRQLQPDRGCAALLGLRRLGLQRQVCLHLQERGAWHLHLQQPRQQLHLHLQHPEHDVRPGRGVL